MEKIMNNTIIEIDSEKEQIILDNGLNLMILEYEEARELAHKIIEELCKIERANNLRDWKYNGSSI